MSRRSSSSGNAVSLFPFLAVLVCVMGALIFLLLATTKRMHDIALAEAEAARIAALAPADTSPPAPMVPAEPIPVAELGTPIALEPLMPGQAPDASAAELDFEQQRRQLEQEWQNKLTKLVKRRDHLREAWRRQQTLHKAAKAQVAELEDTVGAAETRLRGVLAEVESLQEDQSSTDELAALEQDIIALRQKLRLLQNRPTEGNTKFAVIPFDARSGTTRRPILIECTDHGLRFIPEDIVVSPSDLEGFSDRYNPLLAGATALVTYWTAWNQTQPQSEKEPEPYVLLIVRPNGTVAYYVAMKMLSSLKTPFGYELVDDTVELQPPPVDAAAQDACEQAVKQLLAERADIVKHVRDGFRNGTGTGAGTGTGKKGSSGKSSSNTFEVSDVLPRSEGVGERSWENPARFEGRRGTGTETGKTGTSPKPSPEPAEVANSSPQSKGVGERRWENPERFEGRTGPGTDSPPARGTTAAKTGQSSASASRATQSAAQESADAGTEDEPPQSTAPRLTQPTPKRPRGQRPSNGNNAQGEARLEQLARRHWGESEPNATIGIEQNVTVRIDAQQIVVAEDRVLRYQPGEPPQQVFFRLMEAIDAEAQTWGKPRSGFYWTPRLRFVISPGGNQIFERIDPLTIRSGLSNTKEFTLEGVRPAGQEVAP